jgi:hypothetical protein
VKRGLAFLASALASVALETAAQAATRVYVLAIGNDAPPTYERDAADENLPTLRFADDDAAAFFTLTSPLSAASELLTVLDARSQARFPALAARTRPPSLVELRQVVGTWKKQFEADRAAGHDPVLLFFFSGHGSRGGSKGPALVLSDGPLTQAVLYDEVLAQLPARYTHIFVDACYAASVIRPRDAQAGAVDVSDHDAESFAKTSLARFPHVGAVIASSNTARTFEWDVLERGVFTHALLSGLRGGADVNGDGRIEYSEIVAFLAAANREVADPRAHLAVMARPPSLDQRAVILDLAGPHPHGTLTGVPGASVTRRFFVEDALGNRILDVNVERGFREVLSVPVGRLFLRSNEGEIAIDVKAGDRIDLSPLRWAKPTSRGRGAVESAMEQGLFATAYGPQYYGAYLDGRDEFRAVPLNASVEPDAVPASAHRPRVAAWATLGVGAGLGITTAVLTGLTLQAKSDYNGTSLEREAADAQDRFTTYRGAAIAGTVLTAAVVGSWLWLLLRPEGATHGAAQAVGTKPSPLGFARFAGLPGFAW